MIAGIVSSLRLLRVANPLVRAILSSPAHRLLSGSLVVLDYAGRRTTHRHRIPLLGAPDGVRTIALAARPADKQWWRTFRSPTPARLLVGGRWHDTTGQVLADVERRDALRAYLARFPRTAGQLGVRAGPSAADLDAVDAVLVAFEPRARLTTSRNEARPNTGYGQRVPRTPHRGLWSFRSRGSVLSICSDGSVLSLGSVGSILSLGSIGCFASAFSLGSSMSFASTLSWQSTGSLLSAQSNASLLSSRSNAAVRSFRSDGTLPPWVLPTVSAATLAVAAAAYLAARRRLAGR